MIHCNLFSHIHIYIYTYINTFAYNQTYMYLYMQGIKYLRRSDDRLRFIMRIPIPIGRWIEVLQCSKYPVLVSKQDIMCSVQSVKYFSILQWTHRKWWTMLPFNLMAPKLCLCHSFIYFEYFDCSGWSGTHSLREGSSEFPAQGASKAGFHLMTSSWV